MSPIHKYEHLSGLVPAAQAGDRKALARLLSLVEEQHPEGLKALDELFPFAGRAHRIGITGAPGSGKSSLVSQMALSYRQVKEGEPSKRVAIVAIDPTSPFTGGALLGDRIRMRDLAGDEGIFIRSMATRGALGGLAQTTADFVQILDAVGFNVIFVETVGSGQTEVDIARLAHTTLVVQAPNMGDDIQASKAGLLEIADILVANKSDLPGAESTVRMLKAMLEMSPDVENRWESRPSTDRDTNALDSLEGTWQVPVIATSATSGTGIPELMAAIEQHRSYLQRSSQWKLREERLLTAELESSLKELLLEKWRGTFDQDKYHEIVRKVVEHRISPQMAVKLFLEIP